MPWKSDPDIWGMLGAVLISVISGFISIAQRIAKGHPFSVLWVATEFASAILAGYLMYGAYPTIEGTLPAWATLPLCVAVAAHIGGRSFQWLEHMFYKRFGITDDDPAPPPNTTPTA